MLHHLCWEGMKVGIERRGVGRGRDEGLVLRGEGLGGEGMKGWCWRRCMARFIILVISSRYDHLIKCTAEYDVYTANKQILSVHQTGLEGKQHSFPITGLEGKQHLFPITGLEGKQHSFPITGLEGKQHSFPITGLEGKQHSFPITGLEGKQHHHSNQTPVVTSHNGLN